MNVLVPVLVLAGAMALGAPPAAAAVYRCVDRDKKVTYQAEPCKSASGTRIEVPPAPPSAEQRPRQRTISNRCVQTWPARNRREARRTLLPRSRGSARKSMQRRAARQGAVDAAGPPRLPEIEHGRSRMGTSVGAERNPRQDAVGVRSVRREEPVAARSDDPTAGHAGAGYAVGPGREVPGGRRQADAPGNGRRQDPHPYPQCDSGSAKRPIGLAVD